MFINCKTRIIIRNINLYDKLTSVEDLSVKTRRISENILLVIQSLAIPLSPCLNTVLFLYQQTLPEKYYRRYSSFEHRF